MDLMAGRSRGTPPRGSRRLRRWRRVARRAALLLSLAMALLALTAPSGTPLSAQDVAPGPVVARVSGVVFDSVAARPLTGAIVQLVPAAERAVALSVQTDQSGSFAFDSLGAGRYLLGFFHPLLDSLGLAAPITVIDIRVSGAMRVPLATPSARTLVTNLCGPRALADSTGAFIGYVRSATDAMGRPKAQVRVSWSELVIAADGIRRTAPSVQGEASDAGGLALCGIPIGGQVVARAWSGTDSSGFAELDVPSNGLRRRDLGPWLRVSGAEREVGGEGRTIELLEYLLPRNPGTSFRFIIGSDIVADLPKWKSWDRIQQLVQVTVLHRAGHPVEGALGPPMAEVSSTEIRQRLDRGEAPSDLVPRRVIEYARAQRLYGLR